MTVEDTLIDQIVKDVMRRLESPDDCVSDSSPSPSSNGTVTCSEKIVTRELLEEIWKTGSQLAIGESSLLTPSARDFLNEQRIVVVRGSNSSAKSDRSSWRIVVHEPFLQFAQQWNDFEVHTSSCFEESLKHFQRVLSQSETGAVFIVENPEVVVCKANREKTIRACHLADASRLEIVWKQFIPNLFCLSPKSFSNFELQSLIRRIVAIDSSSSRRAAR